MPPPGSLNSEVFLSNLKKFPATHELLLYSVHDYGEGFIQLKMSPEVLSGATFSDGPAKGKVNPFAVHNAAFLPGLKICRERGITHALYLECDCRVGREGWDDVILEEFGKLPKSCIVAGTVVVYNPCNANLAMALRINRLAAKLPAHGIPMGCFCGSDRSVPACFFVNGALAVYDVEALATFFDLEQQGAMSANNPPFDLALGLKLLEKYGEQACDVIGSLSSVLSAYGDVLTTPELRRELLTSGKVVAAHQFKDSWQP